MKKTKWIWIWAAIGLVLGIIIFWPSNRGNKEAILEASAVEEVVDTTEQQQIHYKYGIPDENFIIEEGTVGKNENLSLILSKYKVSPAKIHEISQRCKDVFDVRSIRRGQNYTLFLAQDSLRTPEFFIYEKNALEYVVIDFKETADVYVGKKDIVTKEKTANIIINSNLWNAMVDAQTDPMLAVTLSDIYAWSIDFYGIAKGDSVRVLYEQSYVEDKPLQDFNVKAAIFTNSGKDFYAIPFEQNEKLAYFDEEGYVDGTFNTNFLKLSASERTRNLNMAKTVLISKTNEQLKEYRITKEMGKPGSVWQLLDGVKESEMKNDGYMDLFYEVLGEKYHPGYPFSCFMYYGQYDVPVKGTDKEWMEGSEEVYSYLLCVISPLTGEYEPGAPEFGFLYPAFKDRSTGWEFVNVYEKLPERVHREWMEWLFK